MLRLARCEAPGGFHHIMVRGIEYREIFSDNEGQEEFMERFAKLLQSEPFRSVRTIISRWNKFLKILRAFHFTQSTSFSTLGILLRHMPRLKPGL